MLWQNFLKRGVKLTDEDISIIALAMVLDPHIERELVHIHFEAESANDVTFVHEPRA